jgi:hypothetical protein
MMKKKLTLFEWSILYMKKKTDQERIIKAAQEVLADEVKFCPGRLNPKQIEMLQAMIPKRKPYKGKQK